MVYSSINPLHGMFNLLLCNMATDDASIPDLQIPYSHWYFFHKINSPPSNVSSNKENNALTDCWDTNRIQLVGCFKLRTKLCYNVCGPNNK